MMRETMSPLPDVQVGSDEPLYNIGVVSRMTGLSMPTLRAWERRYDFPESERTAGGHRLYSERDVMRLRWVKARIDEGMQTSQAIQALRHQEQGGHLIYTESFPPAGALEGTPAAGNHLAAVREHLTERLAERDVSSADQIISDALVYASPEDMIMDVITPTFSDIGQLWVDGQISIATEHLATNYLRQHLLMWMLSGPPPRTSKPVVLACAPDEWHEGSLLILGALLRRRRWPVAYLGQSLPLPDLATFVKDLQPRLVVTVAMTENSASRLIEWPKYMPEAAKEGRPIVGYGGRIFKEQPEWRLRMSGIYLGDDFSEGINTVERLLI